MSIFQKQEFRFPTIFLIIFYDQFERESHNETEEIQQILQKLEAMEQLDNSEGMRLE